MGETFAGVASNGPLLLAVGVAALAGLVSFLSPCILPPCRATCRTSRAWLAQT
jgi:cytochrome c biogenesis protein CcdA